MLARVATWEGGSADTIRAAADEMQVNVSKGPPPGVKSAGLTMLVDPDGGRVMMIGFYASAEDLAESEAALKEMNPPEGMGDRTGTDVYEVAVEVRM
jgi:hypothetical protein